MSEPAIEPRNPHRSQGFEERVCILTKQRLFVHLSP
jgi:hypothetical protein